MPIDTWVESADTMTGASTLARLQSLLEESLLIIEHRFYRGSREPYRFICSSYEDLAEYLSTRTNAGDSFWVWSFDACCRDDNAVVQGKVPDPTGRVPIGGAY